MTVTHELSRGNAGRRKAGAEHHVVETALGQFDQLFAGRIFRAFGFDHQATQLRFAQAVVVTNLLFFLELRAEFGLLTHLAAMLSGRIRALLDGFARQAGQFDAKGAHDFDTWSGVTRHNSTFLIEE